MDTKKRWLVLFATFIAWTLGSFDKVAINVALIPIAKEFALTPTQSGAIMSAFALGSTCMILFAGYLADKFRAENVLMIAMVLWTFLTGFSGLAWSFSSMLAIRCVFGAAEGVFPPSSSVIVSKWFHRSQFATAKSVLLSCTYLGTAFGTALVGFLIYYQGWRLSFLILAVLGILGTIFYGAVVRFKDKEVLQAVKLAGSDKVPLREVLKNPIVWKTSVFQFGAGAFQWGFVSWLPQYWVDVKGLDIRTMGVYSILPALISFLVTILMGHLLDKYFEGKERVLMLFAIILAGVSTFLMYNAESVLAGFIYQSTASIGVGMMVPTVYALVLKYVRKDLIGTSTALTAFGTSLSGILVPILMGYSITLLDGSYAAVFGIFIAVLVVCGMLAATIRTDKLRASA